jgi:hypothetical protein
MSTVDSFFTLVAESMRDEYVILSTHYGLGKEYTLPKKVHFADRLGSYWTKTKKLPKGYDKLEEERVLKVWGGLELDDDKSVHRVYVCHVVSKEIRREVLTKVLVASQRLVEAGDPQAKSYPIDYYLKQ